MSALYQVTVPCLVSVVTALSISAIMQTDQRSTRRSDTYSACMQAMARSYSDQKKAAGLSPDEMSNREFQIWIETRSDAHMAMLNGCAVLGGVKP